MKLEGLVPPLELCQQIPKDLWYGATYAHHVFCWAKEGTKINGEEVIGWWQVVNDCTFIVSSKRPTDWQRKELVDLWACGRENGVILCRNLYPAPTVDETLRQLYSDGFFKPCVWPDGQKWTAQCLFDRDGKDRVTVEADTAATAALKLWLEVRK